MNTILRIVVLSTCSVWLWHSGVLATSPPPSQIAYSPDGTLLAVTVTGFTPPGIRLYDAHTLRERGFLEEPTAIVHAVAFSPDGQMLASVGNYGLHLWEVHQGKVRATLSLTLSSSISCLKGQSLIYRTTSSKCSMKP
jgi:WD40 repeat protein